MPKTDDGSGLTQCICDLKKCLSKRTKHTAHTWFLAKAAGAIQPLPAKELARLREIGRRGRNESGRG